MDVIKKTAECILACQIQFKKAKYMKRKKVNSHVILAGLKLRLQRRKAFIIATKLPLLPQISRVLFTVVVIDTDILPC